MFANFVLSGVLTLQDAERAGLVAREHIPHSSAWRRFRETLHCE